MGGVLVMRWTNTPRIGLRGEADIEPRGLRLRRRQSSPFGRVRAWWDRLAGLEDVPTTRFDRRTWEER